MTLVETVRSSIINAIETGSLGRHEKLPSINQYHTRFKVARDTVEKAYNALKKEGYIISIKAKGYYVAQPPTDKMKVLLLFPELNVYNDVVYKTVVGDLASVAVIDLATYHFDKQLLESIIENNWGRYNYFVVMPYLSVGCSLADHRRALNKIPNEKLILLDAQLPKVKAKAVIHQDFENDLYNVLSSMREPALKYGQLVMVCSGRKTFPKETINGAQRFAADNDKVFAVRSATDNMLLASGVMYIVLEEEDLALIIKRAKMLGLKMGKNIGLISYHESVFKDLLGITVVTTDFEEMGRSVASVIAESRSARIKNPFKAIIRSSL